MKMRELARQGIIDRYRMVFLVHPSDPDWDAAIFEQQRQELLEEVLAGRLDASLPSLLRQAEFRRLYFAELPAELETTPIEKAIDLLRQIKRHLNRAFVIGDAAYLKLANNLNREHGDRLLQLIAEALGVVGFALISRFREGDEVACFTADVRRVHAACKEVNEYLQASGFTIDGLPPRVDFGVVTHTEVCDLLIKLINLGWKIPPGSTLKREFFEVALKMAECRQGVIKIYERGRLILELLREVYQPLRQGKLWEFVARYQQYLKLVDGLTRGGKFVVPKPWWLMLSQTAVEQLLMTKTLKKLAENVGEDPFDQSIYRKGVAIFR